jgi:hypothetical protein
MARAGGDNPVLFDIMPTAEILLETDEWMSIEH